MQLGSGARTEPNVRATQVELYDGLSAASQNCWPSVRFDLWALNGVLGPLFPAGFYYKTFMWPQSWWRSVYERLIRRAAGLGRAPTAPDPDRYEHMHAHCDVLVVGAGPAGLMAALAAGRSGARVILVDEQPELGGALLSEPVDHPGAAWLRSVAAELETCPELRVLTRTTAFGYYDHNFLGLLERVTDHLPADAAPHLPRQRLWKVRARQVVLATGALERPLVFAENDRPGIMLASAARTYVNRYAVRPGRRAVVFTNNDSAYRTALDLLRAGVGVSVIDLRADPHGQPAGRGPRRGHQHPGRSRDHRDHGAPPGRLGPGAPAQRFRRSGGGSGRHPAVRSRVRLGRLEPHDPPAVAVARHAALRRRTRDVPAGRIAPARTLGGRVQRRVLAARVPRAGRARRARRRGGGRVHGRAAGAAATGRTRGGARAHHVAGALGPAAPAQQDVRRPAERRHRRRPPPRARRRLPLDRACQALHDDRHGHGPGQDGERQCAGHRCRDHGSVRRRHRRDHLSPALYAGHLRRGRRAQLRRHARPGAAHADARVARGARRGVRGRRSVEAAVVLPGRRARTWRPRWRARSGRRAPASASWMPRRSARSIFRVPMPRSCSIASTPTPGASCRSAAAATG